MPQFIHSVIKMQGTDITALVRNTSTCYCCLWHSIILNLRIPWRCPGIYLSFYNLCDQLLPGYLFIPRSIVAMVTEPLPSYQQFIIAGFREYESWTHCLETARLEHTYFLKYFGPLGRMPHFSLLILILIHIQSSKSGKWNNNIHRKIVLQEHTYTHT
jgi:hypothetical protein